MADEVARSSRTAEIRAVARQDASRAAEMLEAFIADLFDIHAPGPTPFRVPVELGRLPGAIWPIEDEKETCWGWSLDSHAR